MAAIKSYTSLEQSKKLAEILPIESADMHYNVVGDAIIGDYQSGISNARSVAKAYKKNPDEFAKNVIPCWSLAALLDILPKRYNYDNVYMPLVGRYYEGNHKFICGYFGDGLLDCAFGETSVDACVEMIIKLKELTIEQKEQAACGVDLNEDLRGTYIQGYRQAIDDVCEWIGQQHEMLEDCFSDVNDFADLVREATLNKVQVINETYYLSGPLTGTHKEFVDRQIDNIRNRLKEIYGEVLPEKLDKQIGYIVSETYKTTRNHCAQVWNVPPKEGW